MLFTTPEYLIFFAVVLIATELLRRKLWQHAFLLAASYYFYWCSGSIHILLLAFVTLASFFCGAKIFAAETTRRKNAGLPLAHSSRLQSSAGSSTSTSALPRSPPCWVQHALPSPFPFYRYSCRSASPSSPSRH